MFNYLLTEWRWW